MTPTCTFCGEEADFTSERLPTGAVVWRRECKRCSIVTGGIATQTHEKAPYAGEGGFPGGDGAETETRPQWPADCS